MKILLTALVFHFIGSITVKGSINVCIPSKSVDVKDINQLVEEVNQVTADVTDEGPISIGHIDLNITHYAFKLNGTLDNVLIYNLSDYHLCLNVDETSPGLFNLFNITFLNITVKGDYNITGDLGDLFDLFGHGKFWIELKNLSIALTNFTVNSNETDTCLRINIDLDLIQSQLYFDGLMEDEELADLMNAAISSILPESLKIIWSEIKEIFDKPIENAINDFLHGKNITKLLNLLLSTESLLQNRSSPLCLPSSFTKMNEDIAVLQIR